MAYYNIIFDLNKNIECLSFHPLISGDDSNKSFKLTNACFDRNIGYFVLDFMNTDFEQEESFYNFVFKYCFEDLFYKYTNKLKIDSNKYHDKSNSLLIKRRDLEDILKNLYKEYANNMNSIKDILDDIIIDTDERIDIDTLSEEELYKAIQNEEEYLKKYTIKNEDFRLDFLAPEIDDLRLDFVMYDFFPYNVDGTLSDNIPYSFKSNNYLNILYISLKQLLYMNNNLSIRKCANCGKYFIPKTMRDTKYCDEIFKDNKTCKEIGRELAFKERLDKNPLLKTYRTRYQTLSKQAAERDHHEMYEYFKKAGPEMRKKYINNEITDEEFQNWIDSTKVRKK